jgi:uncharacterized membrane protein
MTAEAQTQTQTQPGVTAPAATHFHRPRTDAEAIKDICLDLLHVHDRAEQIKAHPESFHPRLVLSDHVRGTGILDKIADGVNRICGSMWVFLFITVGIVIWLFAGNIIGFDKTPWPLLLVILNLPQLSIMISLQVSANRAQAASDKRAIADHETLIALHSMSTQQLDILKQQDTVLDVLHKFAEKDMPGRQAQIQQTVNQILTAVGGPACPAGSVTAS